MTAQVVELFPANPPKELATAVRILAERAAVQGGPFAQFADVPVSTFDEYTYIADALGDDTYWYHYRYADAASVAVSGFSDAIQAGDSIVRQSVRAEIPDLDISTTLWDRWGREVMIDLYANGIWKEDEAQVTITALGTGAAERYDIPGFIRDVIRLETRDSYGRLIDQLYEPDDFQFSASNRRMRIFGASLGSSTQYWVVGKAQYRALGELTDDFFTLAMHMLLVKYAMYRQHQRLNWKKFITFDPTTDILPRDIAAFIQQEKVEVASRVNALALPEPAIPTPW